MQQIMFSFRGYTAPQDILDAVRNGVAGAFCLFGYNVESPAQLRALCQSLIDAAAEGGFPPPIIGIDQEGGQLMSINSDATQLPGNMALGATRSPDLARQTGRLLGRELRAVGVNMNFAPSLDININPQNPVIGIRSFGDDPALVAELGVALIEGMQAEGVIANAKHFPGHGDVVSDTHHGQALVPYSLKRMQEVELVPFKAAIDAGVGAIMTAHITFSALDDQPATISHRILTGLLREELGYDGLIVTDAMDMHAVARLGAYESVSAALQAGADLIMLGHLPNQLELAAKVAPFGNPASAARVMAAREKLPRELLPLDTLGCEEHLALAQAIADASVTVVRGELPLQVRPGGTVAVITPLPVNLTPADTSAGVTITLADAIERRMYEVDDIRLPFKAADKEVQAALQRALHADAVIIGTIAADQDVSQAALVNALTQAGRPPVVVALRTPYDLVRFTEVAAYLCTYSIRQPSMEAVARVLFGEVEASGKLPCQIPGALTV